MRTRLEFEREHPGIFFLDPVDRDGLAGYLRASGVVADDEAILECERAGAGNMNCVVRVRTDRGSWIVKQARPWVEKYPQFAAPRDRALREMEFYRGVAGLPGVSDHMPSLRHADAAARLLILEDVGAGADYTAVYGGETFPAGIVEDLADYLSALHAAFPAARPPFPLSNWVMRALNAEHIFLLPLNDDNGLDLDKVQPGLRAAAEPFKRNSVLRAEVERVGRDVYFADADRLVHGDFFPGSVLRSPVGPRIIDPEFGFFGRVEFDPGIFVAHLALARQPARLTDVFLRRYRRPAGFDDRVAWQFAGIEIIRRLIGYAQLPLQMDVAEKAALLRQAAGWVMGGPPPP